MGERLAADCLRFGVTSAFQHISVFRRDLQSAEIYYKDLQSD